MKKRNLFLTSFLSALLSLYMVGCMVFSGACPAVAATVYAAGQEEDRETEKAWSEDYYRATDTSEALSDAEQQSLDQTCLDFMKEYHVDLALLAITSDLYEGSTLEEVAQGYYESSGFGYGPGRDGFQMVWDTVTDEVVIAAYGSAKDLIPQTYLDYTSSEVAKYRDQYGVFGPMYATTRFLSNYLRGSGDDAAARSALPDVTESQASSSGESEATADGGPEGQDTASASSSSNSINSEAEGTDTANAGSNSAAAPVSGIQESRRDDGTDRAPLSDHDRMLADGDFPDPALRMGADAESAGMPAWYPRDPATFPFYHDTAASRVVDEADIFSDQEEARMEARLADLRARLQKDIVIHTTDTTYGLSRSVYAADFYDFNGYGIGEDREGVCLMISMESGNRGWWSCCTGPETMGLYTEVIANQIDDLLYEYMAAGNYGAGVEDWIENFRRLYTTGSPYNEDWAVMDLSSFTRFHDPDAPRVIDDAGLLREDEIDVLTREASSLSEKYGVDIVIHTALNPGILDTGDYCERFWISKGYGTGEGYDGLQFTIFKRPNYNGSVEVTAYGSAAAKLTDVNKSRLESRCETPVQLTQYYESARQWLDQTGHMLRTGRAPRSTASWTFSTVIELLAGLIVGGISLRRAKAGMATPKIKENANAYMVRDSLRIHKIKDTLLHSSVHRTYSPPPKEKSGGGSSGGGHSSYSGSYSGSSGSSHSGSGRSF